MAVTADGGKSWTAMKSALPFRSAVVRVKDVWLAVGTSGSDVSLNNGQTWLKQDTENYNAVAATPTGEVWAVGPNGRIARLVKPKRKPK